MGNLINIEITESTRTPIMYVYAVMLSPMLEELLCRRIIQDQLSKHIKYYYTIIISAATFAVLHFNLAGFLGYFLIGIIWGWYYHKSKNIFVPIVSHFLFNYITLLIQSVKG